MDTHNVVIDELDVHEYAQRGEQVPDAHVYRVRIDGEIYRFETPTTTGLMILAKVEKRPCAFELIEEFVHHENDVVEPDETVDLRQNGLKGFITAHKDIVTIEINDNPYQIERGERTVAQILSKVGQTPEGYILLEKENDSLVPLSPTVPVVIEGCEVFFSQVQSGGSS